MKPAMLRPLLLLVAAPLLLAQATPPAPPAAAAPAARPEEQILMPPEPGRFRPLFQRFRTEHAALAPDGRHLAYTVRENGETQVRVVDLDHPDAIKTRVKVVDDRAATLTLGINQEEDNPGQVLWLRWVTSNRVVVGTNEEFLQGNGVVLGFDADGGNARKLADPRDLPPELTLGGSFGIHRGSGSAWIMATPDQEADSVALGFALPAEDDNMAKDAMNPAAVRPHTLRIFDLDARRPGAVTFYSTAGSRGNGMHWVDFYSLEAGRGKMTALTETLAQNREASLMDRQGHLRLTLPSTAFQPFPFRYAYLGAKGTSRAKPLDGLTGAAGFTLSPDNYFGERSIPLGFAEDPNLLYYASNLGRDTYGIYSLNLATGRRDALVMENPLYDLIDSPAGAFPGVTSLVYDRYSHGLAGIRFQATQRTTAWLRPELQAVQVELERAMPASSVEVLEWDEAGRHFLLAADSPADPGAFYVYDREQGKLTEFARRAPWVDTNQTYKTLPFAFTLADGTRLDGFVTIPRQPRMKPIPMILLCPEAPWARAEPGYNREVHALAGMGFVVAQLSGRGAWGYGRRQREAITAGYDLVQVRDVISAVDAMVRRFQINPQRVALMGRGHGGFIALRALQERPDMFRCAIALEPPIDLAKWLEDSRWSNRGDVFKLLTRAWLGDSDRLAAAPLARHPEAITKPIQVLSYPGRDGAPRRLPYLDIRRFAAAVRQHGTTAEVADLRSDYVEGLPGARAEVFDQIEEFLNLHIYDFNVKLHDLKILR